MRYPHEPHQRDFEKTLRFDPIFLRLRVPCTWRNRGWGLPTISAPLPEGFLVPVGG